MKSLMATPSSGVLVITIGLALTFPSPDSAALADPTARYSVRLDPGHPWRPPFRLDRVGQPIAAVVEASTQPGAAAFVLEAFSKGKRVGGQALNFPDKPPYSVRVTLDGVASADELVLSAVTGEEPKPIELARQAIQVPGFEADAVARPDAVVNPVDLGTILVPAGWLLLGPGQTATLELAAISRTRDLPAARAEGVVRLDAGAAQRLSVSPSRRRPGTTQNQTARSAAAGGLAISSRSSSTTAPAGELWRKAIPVMLVHDPSPPAALRRHLRALALRRADLGPRAGTGKFSSMRYEDGWKPDLRDVVVWLPNGGRFVFWRGSSLYPLLGRRS